MYEQQQTTIYQSNRSSSNVHAVESAGRDAPQVLAAIKLSGVQIEGALIDSGSSSSIIASSTLSALLERPSVEQFMHRPPNIVGVGGSSAKVLGYVDVAVVIFDVEMRHPLIAVDKLGYPLLIWTDVPRPHRGIFELGSPDVVRLKLDRCSVCIEERLFDATPSVIVGAVASILADTTLPPHTASRVQVCLPSKVLSDSHFLVEPLPHEHATAACAALPFVFAIVGAIHVLSVVNMSDKQMYLLAGTPIAAVSSVTPQLSTTSPNSAAIHHLPRSEKIRQVLGDLHFDAIKLDAPTKIKLRELIDEFIDVFAECDSDVGSTNVVFHEIDTDVSRPLRQPAPRILYCEQRDAVEVEIESYSRTALHALLRRRGPLPS